ncbi:MAG: HesA/MoeB/ThiF family protein [Spirochaetes bacterium]|nr:HesA/MoeB/ThiF family protein [Spirochaetota bacterium]
MALTEDQIMRYSRHIILKDVGGKGQEKIIGAKVLVIGTGGLGAPVLLYLAAAGVGTIGFADGDVVDLSNLQRQVIHFTPDVGTAKVESALRKLRELNPDVKLVPYTEHVFASNIRETIRDYDFIIDGTDNFAAKFLINDACVLEKKPFSHGGILRFQGQTMTYTTGNTCYRCIFNEPPPKGAVPSCSEAGILGPVAGMLGTIQATEALKYIIGAGELLTNRLLSFDALTMQFRAVTVKRNSRCPICGDTPSITELKDHEQPVCATKAGSDGASRVDN